MRSFFRFARGTKPLSRIEAFSDGVFAIVVTLLILDLKVPFLVLRANTHELAHHLVDLTPELFSWLISFVIVAKFWVNHSHVLGLARRADYALMWLNLLFLMGQAFIPFPTALMGQYPTNALAVSLFGGVMAVNTVLFIGVHRYILRHLLKPDRAAEIVPGIIAKSFVGVGFYLLGAGAAWISPYLACALYAITPVFFIVPPEVERTGAP